LTHGKKYVETKFHTEELDEKRKHELDNLSKEHKALFICCQKVFEEQNFVLVFVLEKLTGKKLNDSYSFFKYLQAHFSSDDILEFMMIVDHLYLRKT